jgi:hypothetical protein
MSSAYRAWTPQNAAPCKPADLVVAGGEVRMRLPRTCARRQALAYVKLLTAVQTAATGGFAFEGRFYRPGTEVRAAELGPAPVLLELSEAAAGSLAERKRQAWEALYIVWRWDAEGEAWREVARAQGNRADTLDELKPAALRALGGAGPRRVPGVAEAAARIRGALERELDGLAEGARREVLAIVHDELAARMAG